MAVIEEGLVEEGGSNGTEIEKDTAVVDPELEPGNEPTPNGGTEDPNGGETSTELENGGGETEAESEPHAPPLDLKKLEESLVEKVRGAVAEDLKASQPQPKMSEEDWAKVEGEWQMPRPAIQKTIQAVMKMEQKLMAYIDSQFSGSRKDAAISNLAKDPQFKDVARLREGIDEFLADYDPKSHADPRLLQRAAFYAKGKLANKERTLLKNTDEKNRIVNGRIRPGKAEGGRVPGSGQKPLNESQRAAAELMPGGEAEYMKVRERRSNPIAV